jgi:hypothetical protein
MLSGSEASRFFGNWQREDSSASRQNDSCDARSSRSEDKGRDLNAFYGLNALNGLSFLNLL